MVRRTAAGDESWRSYAVEFGKRLRQMRLDRGLTQEDVASAAGLSRFVYQQYERGESRPGTPSNPQLRTLVAISRVLGTHVGELLPDPELGEPVGEP